MDRVHVLLRHEPAFDKTVAVRAVRLLAFGDEDGLSNGLLGVSVGVIGGAVIDISVLHGLHGLRKDVLRGDPDVVGVAPLRPFANALQRGLDGRKREVAREEHAIGVRMGAERVDRA